MSDEIKETETTEEIQEESNLQETTEQRIESEHQEAEEKKGIMDTIREKFFPKKEVKEEKVVEPDKAFASAAKTAGFTDEQIAQLAKEYTPEQLKELIPHLMEIEEEEIEEVKEEKPETVKKEQLPDTIKEELKPIVEEMRKFFENKYRESVSELEELKSRLIDQDADKAHQELINQATEADTFFDGLSKDFPVFGKTEELMRYPPGSKKEGQVIPLGKEFEARNSVWGMAMKFNELGSTWKESLNEALAWYKGKHGEKELKNKFVKELKKNEKRLSPKRTAKETTPSYSNENEEKLAILEQAKRKAGIL